MDIPTSSSERKVTFKSPKKFLADMDPNLTAEVVATATDVALIIEDGIIKDIAVSDSDLIDEDCAKSWRGKKWIDTVSIESRPKIEALLNTSARSESIWRQVNHPAPGGRDIPIKYSAVKTKGKDRIIALGRGLRSVSALQQRLVEAHQGLERDYDRLREAEARYRMLFHTVSEAILVVDARKLIVKDVNPAAVLILGGSAEMLSDTGFLDYFEKKSHRLIDSAIADALSVGNTMTEMLTFKNGQVARLSISPFRQENFVRLIVRIVSEDAPSRESNREALVEVLGRLPDALVICDQDFRIVETNQSFLDMTRLAGLRQVAGRSIVDFLGRSSTDFNVLVSSIKSHGSVRNFSTILRDQFGVEERVEVSAVAAPSTQGEVFGLSIRNVERRLESGARLSEQLPKSVDQLTSLVGKVPLKDIVRESSDLIEKLCIEAALEITEDNRASAAEMLGLSRQGLYSKLKRFGVDN